jgi:hypothetical protein
MNKWDLSKKMNKWEKIKEKEVNRKACGKSMILEVGKAQRFLTTITL